MHEHMGYTIHAIVFQCLSCAWEAPCCFDIKSSSEIPEIIIFLRSAIISKAVFSRSVPGHKSVPICASSCVGKVLISRGPDPQNYCIYCGPISRSVPGHKSGTDLCLPHLLQMYIAQRPPAGLILMWTGAVVSRRQVASFGSGAIAFRNSSKALTTLAVLVIALTLVTLA